MMINQNAHLLISAATDDGPQISFKTKHELLERLLFQVDGGAVLDTFALQARDYDEDDSNVIIIARFCRFAPISNLLPQKRQRCLTASRASSVRPSVPKLFWRSS